MIYRYSNFSLIIRFEVFIDVNVMSRVSAYIRLTKPHVWSLLVFTGSAGYLIASGGSLDITFILVTVALIFGTAGANTVTSYFDRDIDQIMFRTMNRPLPKGDIAPQNALYFGLLLVFLSVVLAFYINFLTFILMVIGLFDNIVIYSWWSKRRTPLNILLGAASGGMPTLIGYAAYNSILPIDAWLLFLLVITWTPLHIWTLALKYRDDYLRANVPMLTSITQVDTAIKILGVSSLALIGFSLLIPIYGGPIYQSPIFVIPLALINLIVIYYTILMIKKMDMNVVWRLFKITSPYLTVVYLFAVISSVIA